MWTNEQIAEAVSRPTAIEDLHVSLRRQIDDDILDRPADTIQAIFDRHALAARRVSRATFYRYARKLRLLRTAADLDELLGPDGPSRAKLFTGIQNGLLYQLAEAVNAEEIDAAQIQKLTQSLKSLVTTDIALQVHASRRNAPVRTPSASAGREDQRQPATSDESPNAPSQQFRARGVSPGPVDQQQPATPDESPSTPEANNPQSEIQNPQSPPRPDAAPSTPAPNQSGIQNPKSPIPSPPQNPDDIEMIICRTHPNLSSTSCRARRCDTLPSDTT